MRKFLGAFGCILKNATIIIPLIEGLIEGLKSLSCNNKDTSNDK